MNEQEVVRTVSVEDLVSKLDSNIQIGFQNIEVLSTAAVQVRDNFTTYLSELAGFDASRYPMPEVCRMLATGVVPTIDTRALFAALRVVTLSSIIEQLDGLRQKLLKMTAEEYDVAAAVLFQSIAGDIANFDRRIVAFKTEEQGQRELREKIRKAEETGELPDDIELAVTTPEEKSN